MNKLNSLIVLGIITALFLFLGFPSVWEKIVLFIVGILIIYLSLSLRPEKKNAKISKKQKIHNTFIENSRKEDEI